MTVLGGGLAAEQHGGDVEEAAVEPFFDFALAHEGQEAPLVLLPIALALPVLIKKVLRGGEQWLVQVVGGAQLAQEVGEVVALGEAGELRDVVEADI